MSGLSQHFIRKSIVEKKLLAVKTGNVFRILSDDFNHFIQELRYKSAIKSPKNDKKQYFSAKGKKDSLFENLTKIGREEISYDNKQ